MKNNKTTGAKNKSVSMIHQYWKTTAMKIHSFLSGKKSLLSPARTMIAALVLFVALGSTAMAAATSITLDGPASVVAGEVSGLFTVTADGAVSDTTVLTLTTSDESGTATFNPISVSIVPGEVSATFTYQNTKVGDGTHTITATQSSGDPVGFATHAITVNPGALDSFTVTTEHAQNETAGTAFSVTVTAKDANGNTKTDYTGEKTVAWTTTATGATLPTDGAQTFAAGAVTVAGVTLIHATETPTITATAETKSGTTAAITVNPGAANKLGLTTAPVGGQSGKVLATQPVVTIQDAQGNTVITDDSTVVTVALKSGAGGSVGGTVTATATDGVATFAGVTLAGTVGVDYVLTFTSAPELTAADSGNVNVTAGDATKLNVETAADGSGTIVAAQDLISGNTLTVYAVTRDAQDNFVENAIAESWALIDKDPASGGVVYGDLVPASDSKSAVLTGHKVGKAKIEATKASLTKNASGLITVTAAKINVETAADGSGTIVAAQDLISGNTLTVYAVTRDAQDNFVENVAAEEWILIDKSGDVADGDLVAAGDSKNATLTGAKIGTAKIKATKASMTTITSGTITVKASTATKVVFTTQPSASTVTGGVFAVQPVVTIQDAEGNTVTTATSNVVLTLTTGLGTLNGTASMNAVAGVAAFTNLSIDKAGTNKVLTATVTGLTTADTAPAFAITLSPDPVSLDFTVIYGETPSNQTFTLAVPSDVSPTDYLLVTNRTWLSVADTEGNTSGTVSNGTSTNITVTVSTNGLIIGSTNGTISIGASWLDVAVNVNYKLKPNPTNLTVNVRYGDTDPVTNNFVLTVPADVSPTDYLLVTNRTWLSVADAEGDVSGTVPTDASTNIKVIILPSELSVGSTNGTITAGSDWVNVAVDVVVERGIDTITFSNTNQVYDGTARMVLATPEHAGDVSLTTYNGNAWAPTNAGTYAITGIVDDVNWTCTNTTTLTVTKADQEITFAAIPDQVVTSVVTLSATAGSGLPVSFTNTSGPAVIRDGSNLTFTGAGAVSIVASQAGNGNWNTAETVTRSFNVSGKAAQTITFAVIPDQVVTSVVTLSATASSGLPVSFSATGPAVITGGNKLTFTGAGAVRIIASQTGDSTYNAAEDVTRSFNVTDKTDQTITFAVIPDQVVTSAVTLSATASSGLPVSYTVTGPAVLSGNTLTFTGPGAVSIVASQTGDSTYNAAATVTRTFSVAKADQTIMFAVIPDQVITSVVTLSATASSGLPVSYNVTGPAVITNGNTLTFTGPGAVSIVASQAGNPNWNAAANVTRSLNVQQIEKQFLAADFDGDDKADPTEYDMSTGTWKIWMSAPDYHLVILPGLLGGSDWLALAADFDGDGKADPTVYSENDGVWFSRPSADNYSVIAVLAQSFGGAGYSGIPADYDGDGLADPAVYNRATGDWKVMLSTADYRVFDFPGLLGGVGYMAATADFDGDGKADPAVYNESTGVWQVIFSGSNYTRTYIYDWELGGGYIPIPADYDGDGLADPAVKSETSNTWIIMFSTGSYTPVPVLLSFE